MRSDVRVRPAWSSCGATTSPISSARPRRRPISTTRAPSAVSGWARSVCASCCTVSSPSRAEPASGSPRRSTPMPEAEQQELMWGSPGTILAARELELDVARSRRVAARSARARRALDTAPLRLHGRHIGPAHGFAGCALALDDGEGVSDVLRRHAIIEDGLINWPPVADEPLRHGRTQLIRTHGATEHRASSRPSAALGSTRISRSAAGSSRGTLARCANERGSAMAPRATATRSSSCSSIPATSSARARTHVCNACARAGRAHAHGIRTRSSHAVDGRCRHRP